LFPSSSSCLFFLSLPCSSLNNVKKASDLILLQSYAKLYYQEIVDLLAGLPSDLILLFKANDCLRHLDKILKTPVNSTAGLLVSSLLVFFLLSFIDISIVVAKVASNVILREELDKILQNWHGLDFTAIVSYCSALEKWFVIMSRIFIFSNVMYYGNLFYDYYQSWVNYFYPKASKKLVSQ
jgi:hypothetical protein